MRKSIATLVLFLFALGCSSGTSVNSISDIDNVIAETEDYLIEVDQGRALSSATAEDKASVVYYVTELQRNLVRYKEDVSSVSTLTKIFQCYASLSDYALPTIDTAAIATLMTDLNTLWRAYQTALGVTVGLYDTETFKTSLGSWTTYLASGSVNWAQAVYSSSTYANISGYAESGTDIAWLISPKYTATDYSAVEISFSTACKYGTIAASPLRVYYSFTYPGSGDPSSYFTELTGAALSSGSFTWTKSGTLSIDNSAHNAKLYIAFKYTSLNSSDAVQWELTSIKTRSRSD